MLSDVLDILSAAMEIPVEIDPFAQHMYRLCRCTDICSQLYKHV